MNTETHNLHSSEDVASSTKLTCTCGWTVTKAGVGRAFLELSKHQQAEDPR